MARTRISSVGILQSKETTIDIARTQKDGIQPQFTHQDFFDTQVEAIAREVTGYGNCQIQKLMVKIDSSPMAAT